MTMPRSSATDPGARLVSALVDRDFPRLAGVLTADVHMRALLPPGVIEVSGAEAVAARFSSWFGDAEELELVRSGTDAVGDRLHVFYRLRVKKPDGLRTTVEQHLLCAFDDERLTALDLVCTGFRPDEGGHMHARNKIKLGLSVGLAGLALAVPLAHGGTRPNDRAGMLGVGPQQVADASDVVSRYLTRHPAAAPNPSKTSWRAGELAGTGAAAGAILLAVLAFAVGRRRRAAHAVLQSS
jgi:SnoaL-like domain